MRQQLRHPDGGPVGWIKGLLSWHVYSRKESWKAVQSLNKKGQKAARQMKSTKDKKEGIVYSNSGWRWRWEKWRQWWWWWVRTSRANNKSMWQHFGVLRVKHQNVGLTRWPTAYTGGEGRLGSHPSPNHVIGKRTVNTTLAKGHHADLAHY